MAVMVRASTSSMRATGTPNWMVWMLVRTAASMLGKAQTAADTASGRVEAHRQFGDDGQRAFGTDQKAGQVVAGGGFARPAAGSDDAAVGESTAVVAMTLSRIVP